MELEIQITEGDELGFKPSEMGSGLQIQNSGDFTDRDNWMELLPITVRDPTQHLLYTGGV